MYKHVFFIISISVSFLSTKCCDSWADMWTCELVSGIRVDKATKQALFGDLIKKYEVRPAGSKEPDAAVSDDALSHTGTVGSSYSESTSDMEEHALSSKSVLSVLSAYSSPVMAPPVSPIPGRGKSLALLMREAPAHDFGFEFSKGAAASALRRSKRLTPLK